ncbi:TrwB protein, partial (plasmid) [Klebsiella pneumoniae]
MHKQEVDSAAMTAGFGLPIAGWLAGTQLAQLPLAPFPAAFKETLHNGWHEPLVLGATIATSVVAAGLCYYLYEYCDDGFRGERFQQWLRGSRIRNWHFVERKVNARNAKTNRERRKKGLEKAKPIMVGKLPMPLHLEDRNTMICASIGAGKSVTMEGMIASALRRNDRMAVVDPNGTFYSKFSFKGDYILNPFDARSAGWTIFNEIRGVHDFN